MNGSPNPGTNTPIDLSVPLKIHIIGIGGTGMSALALLLSQAGHRVSGSEIKELGILDKLRAAGIELYKGQAQEQVIGKDLVVYSTAIDKNNIEIVSATQKSIPVRHRGEVLGYLSNLKQTVSVAGTHGKSTITSLITLILHNANWSPSFIVGSEINEVGSSASLDSGRYLVVEADESDGTFLHLNSYLGIVSSIEPDHLDYYGGFVELQKAFINFLNNSEIKFLGTGLYDSPFESGDLRIDNAETYETVVDNILHSNLLNETSDSKGLFTVGFGNNCDFIIESVSLEKFESKFELKVKNENLSHQFEILLQGIHNVYNCAISAAVALKLGVDLEVIKHSLSSFGGISRRFEFRGTKNGITFIDDYAHLPGEIKPTVHATKQLNPQRIVAVFQPHRYSRVRSIHKDFASAFDLADIIYITEIYDAGEQPITGVSGELVYDSIREHIKSQNLNKEVVYFRSRDELKNKLLEILKEGDLLLTLSAGDLTTLPDEIMESM